MDVSHIKAFFCKKKYLIILSFILLLAGFVRLYQIESKMRFIWDEGRDMMAIRKIIAKKDLTLFGPYNELGTEKDFFGVFHYYLMLPWLWLADFNPVGSAIFTATLGIISVALVYQLLSMWSDKKLALAVAAVYALSPVVIKYVIWPWNPNTMPFFGLIYLIFLRKFFEKPTLLWTGLAGLTLGLLFQLHYFSVALVVPWILMMIWKKRKQVENLSFFIFHPILFACMFLLANINFLLFDLTHQGFYFKILKESLIGNSSTKLINFVLQNIIFSPFTFTNQTFAKLLAISEQFTWPITIAFLGYGFIKIKEFINNNYLQLETMVVGGWLGLMILIGMMPTLSNDYYGSYLWFGLLMIIIKGLFKASAHHGHRFIFTIAGVLFCVKLLVSIDLFRQPTWQENMPLVRQLSGVVAKDALSQTRSLNIASLSDSDTRATRYRYFLDVDGIKPLGIDDYSQSKILYVISPHDAEKSRQNSAWEISTFTTYQWQLLDSIGGANVFKVEKD